MKTLMLKGCWNIAKGKLKQKLADLSEDTVEFAEGKRVELVGRIQKRTAQGADYPAPVLNSDCGCHCHTK